MGGIIAVKLALLVWFGTALEEGTSFDEGQPNTFSALSTSSYEATVIRGVVLDEATGLFVGYAAVVEIQTNTSSQANDKGEFKLVVPGANKTGSLKISSLGYAPKIVSVTSILQKSGAAQIKIYLKPSYENLRAVEISAKSRKWKARKVGFNVDKGTTFHHQFSPIDTVVETSGQEIANKFKLKNYPSTLQSISFGLAGSGNVKAIIGLKIYSLKNNVPDRDILPERIILRIPPHHTGWITVDLEKYNIALKEDFAVAVEWLSDTNKMNKSSLLAFAKQPKGQVIYYRTSDKKPWVVQKSTLTSVNSIGLYVTVLN